MLFRWFQTYDPSGDTETNPRRLISSHILDWQVATPTIHLGILKPTHAKSMATTIGIIVATPTIHLGILKHI